MEVGADVGADVATRDGQPRATGADSRLPPADGAQRQARALSDPTRFGIFRYIAGAARPVGVAELTEAAALNHNAVRQHLAKLRDAGLVAEQVQAPDGPGRPRLAYVVTPDAAGQAGLPGPYEWLAVQLAGAVRHKVTAREAGRRAGVAAAAGSAGDGVAVIEAEMERHGFRPVTVDADRRVEIVLERCPFAAAAAADPATVCQLHLGLAEGIAESTGGVKVAALRPHDPAEAGCQLRLRRVQRAVER